MLEDQETNRGREGYLNKNTQRLHCISIEKANKLITCPVDQPANQASRGSTGSAYREGGCATAAAGDASHLRHTPIAHVFYHWLQHLQHRPQCCGFPVLLAAPPNRRSAGIVQGRVKKFACRKGPCLAVEINITFVEANRFYACCCRVKAGLGSAPYRVMLLYLVPAIQIQSHPIHLPALAIGTRDVCAQKKYLKPLES